MRSDDIVTDPTYVYNQYDQPGGTDPNIPIVSSGIAVTTINGGAGPIVSISGGSTGLSFSTGSSTISLSGTLVAASGGTGNSSYAKGDLLAASAATTLTKLAAAANDARLTTDSAETTGLKWIAASTGWGAASGTLSRAAYTAYAGQTVSAAYVQAEAQATDDAVKLLSQTVAALLTDLTSQKIIKT
jgi:hypothetical protein